jgi:Membrane-fusion protein
MNRILFCLIVLLSSCARKAETTHPQIETISESVYASGVIKSLDQYQVYSTVSGVISEINVSEGELVKKGDVLMTIRNEPSVLNAKNAKLAAARADISANTDKLKEAKVNIELAWVKLKNDSLLLIRHQTLKRQGVGTLVELEQREVAYKNSATIYQLAVLNFRNLQRELDFASDQSKNNLKISKSMVNDYLIRAEKDGKVYKVLKEHGELANTLSPVAIIGDASDFFIELNVDEYDIARINERQSLVLTMDSYKGKVFEGRIEKIEPLMNEQSRSFIVRATFVTRPPQLYPNLSTEANIIIRSKQKAVTIPRSYLIGDSSVMVGNHEMRKVQIGIMDYQKAEVLQGLTPSDVIYKIKQ